MDASLPAWTGFHFVPTLHHQPAPSLTKPNRSLPSKLTVCIVGASRGIDAETARLFAQAGAAGLVLSARDEKSLYSIRDECKKLAKHAIRVTTVGADISSEEAAKKLAMEVATNHGRLDVLINNAGVLR
jgi:NAD(P)-dependent dehydrogenase (short-subunit alcohol dehydrogenase family)